MTNRILLTLIPCLILFALILSSSSCYTILKDPGIGDVYDYDDYIYFHPAPGMPCTGCHFDPHPIVPPAPIDPEPAPPSRDELRPEREKREDSGDRSGRTRPPSKDKGAKSAPDDRKGDKGKKDTGKESEPLN